MSEITRVVTDRDKKILDWVNRQGFAQVDQVARAFGISKVVAYRRLGALKQWKYIKNERILGGVGVWYLTPAGARFLETDLRPVKKIPLGTFEHDLKLIDLQLEVLEKYEGAEWLTSREIKAAIMQRTEGNLKRSQAREPDGLLIYQGHRVAIELEISLKNKERIQRKIREYEEQITGGQIAGVWYFVERQSVKNALEKAIESSSVTDRFRIYEI